MSLYYKKKLPRINDLIPNYIKNNALALHLVGIIPINSSASIFNMPWHDCLMPVTDDLLLIEKSVMECALVGCNTIWIMCDKKVGKFLKMRIGEWVFSPNNKIIPIHYVCVNSISDIQKKSLTYEILYGMLISFWTYRKISLWTVPTQYYLSFPSSIYPVDNLRNCWKFSRKYNSHFALEFNGKTFYNSFERLGCTIKFSDFFIYWEKWREVTTKRREENNKDLIQLEEVFSFEGYEDEQKMIIELPFLYKLDNWQGYMNFFGNEEKRNMIERDKKVFILEGKRYFRGFE